MDAKKNESWPKISIVTPSYNQANFLEQTIQSVLYQGYPNLEYIIIDGGSTDGSQEIIQKYEKHLAFWCSEKDQGHYYAVSKGFERSTGEIMGWINSDDLYCPWSLKTVGSIFQNLREVRWISTLNSLYWSKDGYCIFLRPNPGFSAHAFADGEYATFRTARSGFVQQESTFWRRNLWDQARGIDLNFKLAADFDLWARFYEIDELYGVYSPLAGFRFHDTNRSRDHNAYLAEVEASLSQFRNNNPSLASRFRRTFKSAIRHIPMFRSHVKVYSALNIYRSTAEEGDQWVIRKVQF